MKSVYEVEFCFYIRRVHESGLSLLSLGFPSLRIRSRYTAQIAGGCIVRGRLQSDTKFLDVVFKIVDIHRYPMRQNSYKKKLMRMQLYKATNCKEVIPKVYGLYEISVGDAISEDEIIGRLLLKEMRSALQRIHDAGFLHGRIAVTFVGPKVVMFSWWT